MTSVIIFWVVLLSLLCGLATRLMTGPTEDGLLFLSLLMTPFSYSYSPGVERQKRGEERGKGCQEIRGGGG